MAPDAGCGNQDGTGRVNCTDDRLFATRLDDGFEMLGFNEELEGHRIPLVHSELTLVVVGEPKSPGSWYSERERTVFVCIMRRARVAQQTEHIEAYAPEEDWDVKIDE